MYAKLGGAAVQLVLGDQKQQTQAAELLHGTFKLISDRLGEDMSPIVAGRCIEFAVDKIRECEQYSGKTNPVAEAICKRYEDWKKCSFSHKNMPDFSQPAV